MNKSKIEWTDYTWNPLKGLCPVDCKLPDGKSYCYARRMYKRFNRSRISFPPDFISFYPKELEKPYSLRNNSKIFLCSTIELFHPAISEKWRNMIFRVIEDLPQHTFQILTKFPQNIDREMPDNVWLGVSIALKEDLWRVKKLYNSSAKIKFISIEPLLSNIIEEACLQYASFDNINWIIVGLLTGYGNRYNPELEWIMNIVELCSDLKIPLFLKNNLKSIWGENLIQEFPKK